MTGSVEYLTAETDEGRAAIQEVMRHSYEADLADKDPKWALVRIVDEVPVSYMLAGLDGELQVPGGAVPSGFVYDAATREDMRRGGHYRSIVEEMGRRLVAAGRPVMLLHGDYRWYRRLGFDVYTHRFGIFARPEPIELRLGADDGLERAHLLTRWEHPQMQADLVAFSEVRVSTFDEARLALTTAARIARKEGKDRILFMSPGDLPAYPSIRTPFTTLAAACGAEIIVEGGDPEGRPVPHGDWLKVLDSRLFIEMALACQADLKLRIPEGPVCFETDAGPVAIEGRHGRVKVIEPRSGIPTVKWPSNALAQLATGYLGARVLCTIHNTSLPEETIAMLDAIFPRRWHFTLDESWVF